MFHLYQHHDLEVLAELLASLRGRAERRSVLEPDTIVVPNRGTARWLQAQLASSERIAANLDLKLPAPFVLQTLHDTLPGAPDSSDYERERLAWHLYAVLPGVDVPAVQRYLATEPRERHRYQLAMQLADVFDAYLVHRRDVIAQWEAGREGPEPPANWQAPVWRALLERLEPRHRGRLLAEFLERAEAGELDVSRLPGTVYAFALGDLPPDFLRLLHALGRALDVHFLLPNPAAVYWGDVRRQRVGRPLSPALSPRGGEGDEDVAGESTDASASGDPGAPPDDDRLIDAETDHPLLASLGRAGRDFLRVLYTDEFADVDEPDLGEAFAPAPPGDDTLLHRVQSGVIAGEAAVTDAGMAGDDVSIQVHACHGPLREMQVLHDRLLDLMARHDDLEARGILVLLPDVAAYAPAVHSVFGSAEGARYLPYSVSNRPRRDLHPVAQTFQRLIELPLSRWTASEVLALAGVPAVMRRFALDDGDLELLHQWVPAAGVRWGLDRESRRDAGGADFAQNTWTFGLDRLLLGLAQRDEGSLVDGVAPWSDLEGGSGAAVGRLWSLVDRLRYWRDRLNESVDAGAWQDRLNAMTGELFAVDRDDPDETAALDTVHEAVNVLEGAAASLGDEALSWEAVRESLLGALAGPSQRQPMITGGVTFAGLEPLRGVPFDVICLVGMDDGVFPRQDGRREFNLVQKHPRTGDPGVRDQDRMTFLQSLLAARRCFYLSYTGRNVSDGEALQPSPVVGEFLDFLHGHCFAGHDRKAFREALLTEQPMHPFSPRYFATDRERLFTFVADWQAAAMAQRGERAEPAPFLDETELEVPDAAEPIELAELQRFFRHPARWFFQERMRLALGETEQRLDDEEPRALGGLEMHALRDRLFAHAQATGAAELDEEPDALERARGHLPPPPLGGYDHAAAVADVNALLPLHRQWQSDPDDEADVDIDLALDGARVIGRVHAVGRTEMRRMRPGSLRLQHEIPWWIQYLGVVAAGRAVGLRIAGASGGEAEQKTARITPAQARAQLQAAVDLYRRGCARPLLFEPYVGDHYLDRLERQSPEEALDKTNGWLSNRRHPPHPMHDPWLQPVFAPSPNPLGETPASSTFVHVTDAVARPIREHLRPEDGA